MYKYVCLNTIREPVRPLDVHLFPIIFSCVRLEQESRGPNPPLNEIHDFPPQKWKMSIFLSFRIGMSSRGTKVADSRVTVRRVEPIMLRSKRSEEHIGRAGALWDMQ